MYLLMYLIVKKKKKSCFLLILKRENLMVVFWRGRKNRRLPACSASNLRVDSNYQVWIYPIKSTIRDSTDTLQWYMQRSRLDVMWFQAFLLSGQLVNIFLLNCAGKRQLCTAFEGYKTHFSKRKINIHQPKFFVKIHCKHLCFITKIILAISITVSSY